MNPELFSATNVMVVVILLIQLYKLLRPALLKTETGAQIVGTVDAAYGFVYEFAPAIYRIVEVGQKKGLFGKDRKPKEFLDLLRDEAKKQGVTLEPAHEATAKLIAADMAAAEHQNDFPVGSQVLHSPVTQPERGRPLPPTGAPAA